MSVVRSLLLALTVLAAAPGALAHSGMEPVAAESQPEVVVPHHRARAATISLVDANGRLNKAASSADRGRRLAELVEVAKQRRGDLAELVDSDPAEFLRVALPADKRAKLPAEVASLVEDDADETGDLEVLHVDHVIPGNDFYLHFLNTPRGKFSLHFAGRPPVSRAEIACACAARDSTRRSFWRRERRQRSPSRSSVRPRFPGRQARRARSPSSSTSAMRPRSRSRRRPRRT
jgi:hypothetical protein